MKFGLQIIIRFSNNEWMIKLEYSKYNLKVLRNKTRMTLLLDINKYAFILNDQDSKDSYTLNFNGYASAPINLIL